MDKLDFFDQYCFDHFGKGAYWSVSKRLTKIFKSGDVSIILAELLDRFEYFKSLNNGERLIDGRFFYETIEALEEKTGFSRAVQDTCIRKLKDFNLIETAIKTKETRRYFKILTENLHALTNNHDCRKLAIVEKSDSSEKEDENHDCRKLAIAIVGNSQKIRTDNKELNNENHSVNNGDSVPVKKKIIILTKKEIMQKAQSTLVPHITKPKPYPKLVISKPVQEVLDYWVKKGLTIHAEGTASLRTAVEDIERVMDGTMFKDYDHPDFKPWKNRKFPVREIKQAIDIYFLRAHSPQYLPTKKDYLQKLTLSTFFYNRYTSSGLFASEFLTCWAKGPEKTTENKLLAMEDKHPELTKILSSWYRTYFSEPKGFSIMDRNNIIKATRKIVEFVNNCNGNIIQWKHETINPNIFVANCLVDAMKDMLRNNEGFYPMFESSWLASDTTFNERLPKYMRKENKLR